jgi:hypothetical protein
MWVKLDDTFPDHPKVERAGPAAAWLYVCGLCYCARYLTDGLIPGTAVARLTALKNNRALAEKLVEVGLWERDGEDYMVHNYQERNPSKAQIEEKRRQTRERIADWRSQRKSNSVTQPACNAVTTAFGNAECSAPCNASPVPSSPVLDPDLDPKVGGDMPDSPRGEPVPLALLSPEPEPAPPPPPKRRKPKGKPTPAGERVLSRLRELSGREFEYSPELEARLNEGIPEADLLAVVEFEARPDGLRGFKGGRYYQPSTLFRPTKIRERIAQARAARPRARDAPEAPPLPDLDTIEARAATDAWLAQLPDRERERVRRQAEAALVARGVFPGDGPLRDEIARMARQHGGDHAA